MAIKRIKITLRQKTAFTEEYITLIRDYKALKFDKRFVQVSFTGDFNESDRVLVIPTENILYMEELEDATES